MSGIGGDWILSSTQGTTKSQWFCSKNFTSVFPSHEQTFRPLGLLQIHLPSFDFLISAVLNISHV